MRGWDGVCWDYGSDELQEDGGTRSADTQGNLTFPLPYFIFWRLLFEIIKDGRLQVKLNTHSTAGQAPQTRENTNGKTVFVWFYFYDAVCEVFVLHFLSVQLIWFRLEFVADVNKKRAFYH